MTFYEKYIKLCEEHNENPRILSMTLGAKSNTNIDQWKKGSTPRKPILTNIAQYFNVPVAYLISDDELQSTKKAPSAEADGAWKEIAKASAKMHRLNLMLKELAEKDENGENFNDILKTSEEMLNDLNRTIELLGASDK